MMHVVDLSLCKAFYFVIPYTMCKINTPSVASVTCNAINVYQTVSTETSLLV